MMILRREGNAWVVRGVKNEIVRMWYISMYTIKDIWKICTVRYGKESVHFSTDKVS